LEDGKVKKLRTFSDGGWKLEVVGFVMFLVFINVFYFQLPLINLQQKLRNKFYSLSPRLRCEASHGEVSSVNFTKWNLTF